MAESNFDILRQITTGGRDAADWLSSLKAAQLNQAKSMVASQQAAQAAYGQGLDAGAAPGATASADALSMLMRSIGVQESGNNYGTNTGNGMYGKYQVAGTNVPSWTKAALGTSMTPQQFLHDKAAQDAVAQQYLGNYVKQYGLKGAAAAWNAGEYGASQGGGKDYAHEVMQRMRGWGYTNGQQPASSGGYSGPGGGWVSPVAGFAQGGATSGYGWRINPVSGERSFHEGTDYAAPIGSRVGAAHGGTIVESGWDPVYGNRVIMRTPKGKEILYGHLNNINDRFGVGESVNAGQRIGRVGSTGWSTGPHLHFGVYNPAGDPMNPQKWINRMGQPGAPTQNRPSGSQQGYQAGKAVGQAFVRNPNDKFQSILRDLGL